jgi:hypothetical protein
MRVPDLIRAIRDVVDDVPGVAKAYYPAPNGLNAAALPAVVLYWSGTEPSAITHQAFDEQLWAGTITGHLLTARKGDTPQEFGRIDDLITPVVDAFAMDGEGMTVTERHPERFGGGVYRCLLTAVNPTQSIPFAGQDYYGAELMWSYRLDRRTGSA